LEPRRKSSRKEALVEKSFGDDLYVEIMRHNQEDENRVNATLIKLVAKHGKLVATNNTFYIKKRRCQCTIFYFAFATEKQTT
jgi:DNA polymerase-3 subunit alpha